MISICDLPRESYAEVFLSDLSFGIIPIPEFRPLSTVFNLVKVFFMATSLSNINSFACYVSVFPWWSKCQILASLSEVPARRCWLGELVWLAYKQVIAGVQTPWNLVSIKPTVSPRCHIAAHTEPRTNVSVTNTNWITEISCGLVNYLLSLSLSLQINPHFPRKRGNMYGVE